MISSIDECQGTPDYVIEVAGQAAVKEHAKKVLEKGWTIGLISVGTLADNEFLIQLKIRLNNMMPIYIFWQVRLLELMEYQRRKKVVWKKVTYKGCKSPKSWRGSYAEQLVDLDQVSEATVFRGTAREAALKFPANANVAATIALAGLGMDETMVELTVDPNINKNKHTIVAEGVFGEMTIELVGYLWRVTRKLRHWLHSV